MSPRILVVEDESAIRLALRGLLRRDGHEVDLAESGDAALRMLERDAYDLITLFPTHALPIYRKSVV